MSLDQMFNLKDKIVVVTGANGNLGKTICNKFSKIGASVIGVDLENSEKDVENISFFALDITKRNNVISIFDKIIHEYGKIDVLINNAGVGTFEPFEERAENDFNHVIDVNLKGTFNCIQAYVNIYDRCSQEKGAIVNIASLYGVVSSDFRIYTDCKRNNSEIYSATKAGIIQMTKYFSVHLANRNIRVNALSPGGIYNQSNPQGEDFIQNYSSRCPMNRMANYDEMIGGLIYLSSDSASYVTGHNLVVDGGFSAW